MQKCVLQFQTTHERRHPAIRGVTAAACPAGPRTPRCKSLVKISQNHHTTLSLCCLGRLHFTPPIVLGSKPVAAAHLKPSAPAAARMSKMISAARGPAALVAFFGLVCVALCITTIVLIADNLYPGAGWYQVYLPALGVTSQPFYLNGACLMTNNGINVCRYGYSVAAIGILSSLLVMAAMCAPAILTIIMSAFNSIWFLAWAITATVYSDNFASDESIPREIREYNAKYRRDVYALAWTMFSVSFVSLALSCALRKKEAAPEKPLPGTAPVPASEPDAYTKV
ncbi:hypothetical protein ABPG75_008427 [Micractinium tetrahymenae]